MANGMDGIFAKEAIESLAQVLQSSIDASARRREQVGESVLRAFLDEAGDVWKDAQVYLDNERSFALPMTYHVEFDMGCAYVFTEAGGKLSRVVSCEHIVEAIARD